MNSETQDKLMIGTLAYRIWLIIFRLSGIVLVCCMLPVVALPHIALPTWFYWLAACSAFLCGVAAYLVRKYEQYVTTGDAAWVMDRRERGAKTPWDVDADD